MIYFRDFSLHPSSKRSQRKHPLLWLLLWWEQCLKLLSVCVWKKPWWRSGTTMLGLSDRPWTILAQWHPCQNSSLNLPNVFTLERLWSLYTTWHMALLTATLQHVTSCFSLFTHCENSACASKAANREKKIGACSLYVTMKEQSSSEIFLFINYLVADTLPHFFVSTLRNFFIHKRQSIEKKKLSIAWNTAFLVKNYWYFLSNQ